MPGIQDAYNYFTGQGWSPSAAAGISSGLFAESNLNPSAVNPTSGAFGIGQWLGARKQQLFNMFGSSPSFEQQLSFVNTELGQGNGGSIIAGAMTPRDALTSFINLFERPGPGAAGDIQRGSAALSQIDMGGAQMSLDQAQTYLEQIGAAFGGSSTGQAQASAGGLQSTSKASGGLFGPLIDWFNGLTKGIESGIQDTLTRGAFITVGLVLLAAGIFFVASNNGAQIRQATKNALTA